MVDKSPLDGIPERVARGVALLDAKRPGWPSHLDPEVLDIESCWHCVIGQLYRSAMGMDTEPFEVGAVDLVGLDAYGYDNNAPVLVDHGFSGRRSEGDKSEFDALTVEWQRVISERLAEQPSGGEA